MKVLHSAMKKSKMQSTWPVLTKLLDVYSDLSLAAETKMESLAAAKMMNDLMSKLKEPERFAPLHLRLGWYSLKGLLCLTLKDVAGASQAFDKVRLCFDDSFFKKKSADL